MKITDLQKRYDNAKAAIKTLEEAMPSENECTENIYLMRNGEIAKDAYRLGIKLASVCYRPDLNITVNKETHSYITIYEGSENHSNPDYIKISVEAIKPLIKILEDLF